MVRVLSVAAIVVLAVIFAPIAILPTALPDADAPPAVESILPDAKRYLAQQLDLPLAHVRLSDVELRARDDLVILMFELRPFPYIASEGAYVASRCTPLERLHPQQMGGGRGVADFATDTELAHLRSDAQPPCGS
jgi:hypothetical protein